MHGFQKKLYIMEGKVKQIQNCNDLGNLLMIFISSKAQESFKLASYYVVLYGRLKSEVNSVMQESKQLILDLWRSRLKTSLWTSVSQNSNAREEVVRVELTSQ